MGRYFSKEQRDELRAAALRLSHEGLGPCEIATHLGVAERTVTRYRRDAGLARPAKAWTPAEHEHALAMIADGASLCEAARTLGRTEAALRARFPGMGWTPQQVGAYNAMRRYEKRML